MHAASRRTTNAYTICILLFLLATADLASAGFRMDGDFMDWEGVAFLARDPAGDAEGAFDVTQVFAASQGSTLYLRFDTGRVLNIQNGPENEGTLGIVIGLPNHQKLRLDTRRRRATLDGDSETRIPWSRLQYVVGPTHAQDEFELRIDLSRFNVGLGDSVSIQFDGSDQLDTPVAHLFVQPDAEIIRRPAHRFPGTDIRIVSLNAYVDGLSDPNRSAAFERLLKAVDGDVFCFQEEWESTAIKKIMNRLRLLDTLGLKHIHQIRGNIVASKFPLKALPSENGNYSVARIDVKGHSLFVMSVHLSAMGYIGSKEDLRRIQQAGVILNTVSEIRSGIYSGSHQRSGKPGIVMIGDYNLVGSRLPVDLLAMREISGLENWVLPHLTGESIVTWRGGERSSFSPGKLDYSLYSSDALVRKNGFVLNSELLNEAELSQLALKKDDSSVSDHLLMVTDYHFQGAVGNPTEAP